MEEPRVALARTYVHTVRFNIENDLKFIRRHDVEPIKRSLQHLTMNTR